MTNTHTVNSVEVNGSSVTIIGTGSGSLVLLDQFVGIIGSGSLILLDQDVNLRASGSGSIILLDQDVLATASGSLILLSQRVQDSSTNTFLSRNGFTLQIEVGGYNVPADEIHGVVAIDKAEGQSMTAQVTFLPALGVVDPEFFQGKSIKINHITLSTNTRLFTGFVDTPDIDMVDGKLTLNCSDRRNGKMESLSQSYISGVGSYSDIIFGKVQSKTDELSKRTQTIAGSFDFDNYGNPTVTPWAPKSTADYTLGDSDIYRERPDIVYSNRNASINTVNMTFKYSYQRLHQQLCSVSWLGFSNFCNDWFEQGKPSFPLRQNVFSAAQTDSWHPTSFPSFTALWPAGGFACTGGSVVWQPNQVTNEYAARTTRTYLVDSSTGRTLWANGKKYPIDSFVLDADGKKIYDIVQSTIVDTSSQFCRGASWTASRKFAQTVEEDYTVQLRSLKAHQKYGTVITSEENYSFDDTFDTNDWENDERSYKLGGSLENFYINKRTDFSTFLSSIGVALNKARATLFSQYRDVDVSFRRDLWAEIDLMATVAVNTTLFTTKGKVYGYSHEIDVSEGRAESRVTLRLSRLSGTDSTDAWAVSIPQEDATYIDTNLSISLQTNHGKDPDPTVTPGAEEWNGWIGNSTISSFSSGLQRTTFAESFTVDYPAIPDAIRKKIIYTSSDNNFIIDIPNNTLTWTNS